MTEVSRGFALPPSPFGGFDPLLRNSKTRSKPEAGVTKHPVSKRGLYLFTPRQEISIARAGGTVAEKARRYGCSEHKIRTIHRHYPQALNGRREAS